MTEKPMVNMAHSVHQRLLNKAQATGRPFDELLQYYASERFLYRFSRTDHGHLLLLKGALLLRVWGIPSPRPTMDIDMMGSGGITASDLEAIVKTCMTVESADGLVFHSGSIVSEAIRGDAEFQGWRLLFSANLGPARIKIQLDVGLGDIVVPAPVRIELPCLLDFPSPSLMAYPPETAIAEKFDAMVKLEKANSRMKDFYDLRVLSLNLGFQGAILQAAIQKTFERRGAMVPKNTPLALTSEFSNDPTKLTQWNAFKRRLPSGDDTLNLQETVGMIHEFIMPPVLALHTGLSFDAEWSPGGPWREKRKKVNRNHRT